MRDLAEENPLEVEASKFNLNYIKLDGNDRLHGQRRRARHGDHGHHQALRRRAGQLPRRRRRRVAGGGEERVPHPGLGPQRARRPDQHLRRHRPHRPHRPRRGGRHRGARATSPCRWWCGSRGRTSRRGGASCAKLRSRSSWPRTWPTPPRKWWPRPARSAEGANHGDLGQQRHAPAGAGHHRQGGNVPRPRLPRLRDEGGGRRHARQGRRDASRAFRSSTRWRRPARRRAPTRR